MTALMKQIVVTIAAVVIAELVLHYVFKRYQWNK